jgi:hypothetical protein
MHARGDCAGTPSTDIIAVMAQRPKPKPDDPAQYKRFIEAARKAEAAETEEEADRAFKKIALPKKSKKDR